MSIQGSQLRETRPNQEERAPPPLLPAHHSLPAGDGVVLRKPDRYGSPRGTAIPHPYQGFPWLQVFTGVRRSPFGIVKTRGFHRCYVARHRREPIWTDGTKGWGKAASRRSDTQRSVPGESQGHTSHVAIPRYWLDDLFTCSVTEG